MQALKLLSILFNYYLISIIVHHLQLMFEKTEHLEFHFVTFIKKTFFLNIFIIIIYNKLNKNTTSNRVIVKAI
jgi:hypothetical protein